MIKCFLLIFLILSILSCKSHNSIENLRQMYPRKDYKIVEKKLTNKKSKIIITNKKNGMLVSTFEVDKKNEVLDGAFVSYSEGVITTDINFKDNNQFGWQYFFNQDGSLNYIFYVYRYQEDYIGFNIDLSEQMITVEEYQDKNSVSTDNYSFNKNEFNCLDSLLEKISYKYPIIQTVNKKYLLLSVSPEK